ncbi:MAG: type I restriction enzyme HsdR N-terminal domain-containing protein [Desulfobacterales bacterium]|uniref:Type I restriction enzyme HsdR N-terminal domain-containing protein n=1 Tax=Candidatus Desulfaltia bathyphila TaxID=2841697 RepID=A0A8J6N300_9BACT|nr:type I restriction enzyme HsdR N-terminal domain-containing protein [Candidatus Desulfaltia bathyphila]MBL7195100.1 type I restriction enzyme HsdR N-terminal domain-containing protein [Desulfobacterales bacterium]MBL7207948.1 type I restriction enzyme HsdR N-terminal domain-containing protein [Desulfobacterales bacterium]
MGKGYLVLGELTDYITGKTIKATHDERYRQKLARLLVDDKGYQKNEIKVRHQLLVNAGDKRSVINVDFMVTLSGRICMIIKYGPGSLVTRRRPALAVSRLVSGYQVPVVVVSNGEDAEIIDGSTGKIISHGLDSIPSKLEILEISGHAGFTSISEKQAMMEARIVYAFEIDGSCSI